MLDMVSRFFSGNVSDGHLPIWSHEAIIIIFAFNNFTVLFLYIAYLLICLPGDATVSEFHRGRAQLCRAGRHRGSRAGAH